MTDTIKAIDNFTKEPLVGYIKYSKEWGENLFYSLDGGVYFEPEITIINTDNDCRFPTIE